MDFHEKYYEPITLYYIANCVTLVPNLILFNLWTNWTYKHTLRIHSDVVNLLYYVK